MSLGKWAVIDIETTGLDPSTDEIIDLGFLQFDGTKLTRSYSSLVRPNNPVSVFITKLTGITSSQLIHAPSWEIVENDLASLESHNLVAHNAHFEESFLKRYFEKFRSSDVIRSVSKEERFHDSIYYLSILFPQMSFLNLEHFINHFGIADKEEHRGLSDSRDLLKVLLVSTFLAHQDVNLRLKLVEVFSVFFSDFFLRDFFSISTPELIEIADQLDFPLLSTAQQYKELVRPSGSVRANSFQFEKTFSSSNIQSILKEEKGINSSLLNYKYRPSQEQLALRVGQSLKNNIHALIQAPTGTGKTMGYLLPSFLFSLEKKTTVLISTGTKTLQHQAIEKDVPQIKGLLNLDESFKVIKLVGSSNHLCELIFREKIKNMNLINEFSQEFSQAYFEMLFFYNSKASYDKKLTREEIPFVLKKLVSGFIDWESELAVDYRACAGHRCPLSDECSYFKGLKEAKEAQVIIGNHALMLNWPKSFSRPLHVIIDEAHRLEQEATRAFSIEIHQKNLDLFHKNFPQGMGGLIYILTHSEISPQKEEVLTKLREETQFNLSIFKEHLDSLPLLIESWFKKMSNYSPLYSNELGFPKKDEIKDPLTASILHHFESIGFILEALVRIYSPFQSGMSENEFTHSPQLLRSWVVFESNYSQLEKLEKALRHFLQHPDDWSSSLRFLETEGYQMDSFPIDVGRKIHEELISSSSSVIFTSATLANASGDEGVKGVEWGTGYSYIPPEKRFRSGFFLPPVFDFEKNARVYLCSDTRSISDPLFIPDLLKEIIPLISRLGGKTLLLFSSRIRFNAAAEILIREFDSKIPVFIQGMGKKVVDEFKKETTGILIGMESFGEGIDVPGEKLSFVVIDKIPDLRQDLVIQKRREFFEHKFGNEFNDYFLSHRTRSLHQKFGRLIRSETDHGAILLVDNRVKKWKKGTLKTFHKLMEPYRINFCDLSHACEEIAKYFDL